MPEEAEAAVSVAEAEVAEGTQLTMELPALVAQEVLAVVVAGRAARRAISQRFQAAMADSMAARVAAAIRAPVVAALLWAAQFSFVPAPLFHLLTFRWMPAVSLAVAVA